MCISDRFWPEHDLNTAGNYFGRRLHGSPSNRCTMQLWILSLFFSYKIYDSINGPINFNKVKEIRYSQVIDRMKIIRKAQIAHRDVKGFYANNFDSLIKFVDQGIFTLIEKKDSSYLQYDRIYRIDMLREVVVIDTLGFVPVKDSLFKENNDYKLMSKIPIDGLDASFEINSDLS